jgi:hypothetical protein
LGTIPQKTVARRGDNELPFVNANLIGGQGLLLDTCVHIDQMQGRSPQMLDDLIASDGSIIRPSRSRS